MRSHFFYILLLIISTNGLFSCTSPSPSGPCDYTEEKFNMRIIDVKQDPDDESNFIVAVDFDGNVSYADQSLTLDEVRDVQTNMDFIINNNIKVGNVYSGTAHIKVKGSGDCVEEIIDWNQKLRK